jgi:hypothetical protein
MPGFNTIPGVSGGGSQPNMTFVASVHMQTYNRSWSQGGTPGYYGMFSANQENGYAYFVGGTTTGVPLNRLVNITHSFTRIDIVAPVNDMLSLYKAKVKATTEFANALSGFASFPSVISSSGNFVLPNNALPLVNVMLVGGGGGGGRHAGGGGGGGGIVKLTAYQAVGTTSVTVGSGGLAQHRGASDNFGSPGNRTFFGNVYALGGQGGAQHGHGANNNPFTSTPIANGGGGGGHNSDVGSNAGGTGTTQTSSTGLGTTGSPVYHGGFSGGAGGSSSHAQGGGGAGAGGAGGNSNGANHAAIANGGAGHASDISGTNTHYSVGGSGGTHGTSGTRGPGNKYPAANWVNTGTGMGGFGGSADGTQSGNNTQDDARGWDGGPGLAIVRYYIP